MASDGPVANMQPAVETPITPRANADDGDEVETGLVSGVKVELVDWSKYARPCEVVLLTCVGILLVVFGLSGTTWTSGYNAQLKLVTAGLHWSRVAGDPWDMQTGQLNRACAAVGRRGTVACSLATAGNMAAACGWIAFVVACVLAGTFLAQGLDKLGALGGVRAKLPPTLPLEALASYLPTACWALLLVLLFLTCACCTRHPRVLLARAPPACQSRPTRALPAPYPRPTRTARADRAACATPAVFTLSRFERGLPTGWHVLHRLLTYAAMAPASLGGGLAYLGASYGAVRLAFFLSLLGLGVNLSLFHKLGEDYVRTAARSPAPAAASPRCLPSPHALPAHPPRTPPPHALAARPRCILPARTLSFGAP